MICVKATHRFSAIILLLTIRANLSLLGQSRSTVVPIIYPLFDRTDLPIAGIGHFLREDYRNGSFFAISEGLTYYFWKSISVKRDTVSFPCVSTPSIAYRRGVRGLSPGQSASLQFNGYSYQNFANLRFLDAFTTYRNYRANEAHTLTLTNRSVIDLSVSPFRWKYLREPDVYIPLLFSAGASFLDDQQGQSIFDLKSINWFGQDVSTTTAAVGTAALETFGFALLAVAEEGFFRGVIQTELSERVNPNFGLIASSILFGLAHHPFHSLTYSLRATLGGLYLGWRYKESDYDLGRPIAIHFYIDFMPIIVQLFRDPISSRGAYSVSS